LYKESEKIMDSEVSLLARSILILEKLIEKAQLERSEKKQGSILRRSFFVPWES